MDESRVFAFQSADDALRSAESLVGVNKMISAEAALGGRCVRPAQFNAPTRVSSEIVT